MRNPIPKRSARAGSNGGSVKVDVNICGAMTLCTGVGILVQFWYGNLCSNSMNLGSEMEILNVHWTT